MNTMDSEEQAVSTNENTDTAHVPVMNGPSELPSSDVETDKMEEMEDKESELERLSEMDTPEPSGLSTSPATTSTSNNEETNKKRPVEKDDKEVKEEIDSDIKIKKRKFGVDEEELEGGARVELQGEIQKEEEGQVQIKAQGAKAIDKEFDGEIRRDGETEGEEPDNKPSQDEHDLVGEEEDEAEDESALSDVDKQREETNEEDEERKKIKEEEEEEKEKVRVLAMNELKVIEISFAQLKDKLYETQLNKLEFELKLCEKNEHPDFLEYMKMIDENFKRKIDKFVNLQKFKLKCLENQTTASRVAIHQQYIKHCQDLKSNEILEITSNWYDINKERRSMDLLLLNIPEYYQYKKHINYNNVEDNIGELVVDRNALFNDLSEMEALVKYKKLIPSSLNDLKSCTKEELDNDLKEMGL